MKKIILLVTVLFFAISFSYGQRISKNALGVRLGDDDGFDSLGAEVSYQLSLLKNNRLEFDLGIRTGDGYDAFKIVGLFQWVMPLDNNFNWYVGTGAGLGSVKGDFAGAKSNSFALLAGDVGIEYNFKIPLLLSLDLRPELGFGDDAYGDGFDFDLGLGIRYQF